MSAESWWLRAGTERGDRNRQSKKLMNCEMYVQAARGMGRWALGGGKWRSSWDLAVGQDDPTFHRRRCKHVISRRLREKQAFLSHFSVVRGLISRRLRESSPFFLTVQSSLSGPAFRLPRQPLDKLGARLGAGSWPAVPGRQELPRFGPRCPGLSRVVPPGPTSIFLGRRGTDDRVRTLPHNKTHWRRLVIFSAPLDRLGRLGAGKLGAGFFENLMC